jgi:anti-sigma B factor antagonist
MPLELTKRHLGDEFVVVEARGDADLHSAQTLRLRLIDAVRSTSAPVIVDLSQIEFIDSTGMGALVAARNEAVSRGSALRVACPSERVMRLFRVTGLDDLLGVRSSLAQAMAE